MKELIELLKSWLKEKDEKNAKERSAGEIFK
jgi:hypothetical protein